MSKSFDFGKEAEHRTAAYLVTQGFSIVKQNFRYHKAEVDLNAKKDKLLIAVEVKARSTDYYGSPQQFVTQRKINL